MKAELKNIPISMGEKGSTNSGCVLCDIFRTISHYTSCIIIIHHVTVPLLSHVNPFCHSVGVVICCNCLWSWDERSWKLNL